MRLDHVRMVEWVMDVCKSPEGGGGAMHDRSECSDRWTEDIWCKPGIGY